MIDKKVFEKFQEGIVQLVMEVAAENPNYHFSLFGFVADHNDRDENDPNDFGCGQRISIRTQNINPATDLIVADGLRMELRKLTE